MNVRILIGKDDIAKVFLWHALRIAPHSAYVSNALGSSTSRQEPRHAEGEAYHARLAEDPLSRKNDEFAQKERFLLGEDRTWLKLASAPHGDNR